MEYITASLLVLFALGLMIPNASAQLVPDWVKNTAGWWAEDAISETEFVNAIEFLVKENIIQVNVSQTSETSQSVPDWVKNTAGWWADDKISEGEFVNAIAYLIKIGIISIESSKSPELIAEMWINGEINDDEFLANVEQLIETGNVAIPDNSVTKSSQLPDWLVNNAGWWAARIFTNSDFDFDPGYIEERVYPCDDPNFPSNEACPEVTINSLGFRGNEFEKEKPDNTFRIIAVGGSTTYSDMVQDSETWPVHLQKIINEKITGKKIEVINAGINAHRAESEYGAIKNKLSSFDPDLIIMYDGWNDAVFEDNVKKTIQNWESVCKLGKNEGFDTLIIIQPLTTSGHRVLTEQEIISGFDFTYLQTSQQYVDAFEELDKVCTKTADFRRIFDYVQEPIFLDHGHTMDFGNKIIAENVFSVISPIYFGKTYSLTQSDLQIENNEPGTGVVYTVGADLSGKNFDNLNLQNAVFDKTDLSNTSFKNANIDGARFLFADLSNTDLSGHNLTETILIGADLSNANLANTILAGADLSYVNLTGVDLSGKDLTGTILKEIDLSYSNLSGVNLVNIDLIYANLTGVDLSGKDLTGAQLGHTNLADADLENVKLTMASLVNVDLTKIKNKSLAGSDLSGASFTYSNLSGVDLSGAILYATNFNGADLSGQDFTVISNKLIDRTRFTIANLSNSNFEGVNMEPTTVFSFILENEAHLNNLSDEDLIDNLFGEQKNILIVSKEVRGNDLVVVYLFFNNFDHANLENANFKNANLRITNFNSANLTNADLSGANLINAFLGNADLSNANLEGTNLQDAILDNAILSNANLKCLNHPICLDK
jgi:uncharacterized protein YjbI with pentapeptide repeats